MLAYQISSAASFLLTSRPGTYFVGQAVAEVQLGCLPRVRVVWFVFLCLVLASFVVCRLFVHLLVLLCVCVFVCLFVLVATYDGSRKPRRH